MGTRVFIPEARISYAQQLFTAKKVNPTDADAKFGSTFIIRADSPALQELAAAVAAETQVAHPNGAPQNFRAPPWYDGTKDGLPGFIMVRAYAKTRPYVVDGDLQPIIDPSVVYSGCVVNASISVYTYLPKPTPGVTFGLDGVQYVRDGERLDGRPTIDQLFQKISGAPAPSAGAPIPGVGAPGAVPSAPGAPAGPVMPTSVPGVPGAPAGPGPGSTPWG